MSEALKRARELLASIPAGDWSIEEQWSNERESEDATLFSPMTVKEILSDGVLMSDGCCWTDEELEQSGWFFSGKQE